MPTVCFNISGEFLTNHSRDLVREGKWDNALKLLVDDIHGMTYEIAIDILKGDKKLIGDSREDNIDLDDDNDTEFKSAVDYLYAGSVKIGDQWFKPYTAITNYGRNDCYLSRVINEMYSSPARQQVVIESMTNQREAELRALHYAENPKTDAVYFLDCIDPVTDLVREMAVLFERIEMPPLWYKVLRNDPKEALKQYLDHHKIISYTGHSQLYGEEEVSKPVARDVEIMPLYNKDQEREHDRQTKEVAEEDERMKRYKKQIIEQADEGEGWMTLHLEHNGDIKVPKAPFIRYALRGTSGMHLAPEWTPVCPSGLKMYNDDRCHTDWMVGAGIDLNVMYDYSSSDDRETSLGTELSREMYKVQEELLDFKCHVLNGNRFVSGIVVHPKPNETVMPGRIVVIPNAGPDYVKPVLTASLMGNKGAVITEVGGEMAHLVGVSREKDIIIIRVENARKLFPEGTLVDIDAANGKVGPSAFMTKLED